MQAKDYFAFGEPDTYGDSAPTIDEITIRLRATWTDDLNESGDTGPKYYRVKASSSDVISVVAPENIEEHFPHAE
ncbi:MAG: hypothetical protein HKN37_10165 [Rhodothermales bacterium]|nr:hypothetical protein [Rhodothermales bacterium]